MKFSRTLAIMALIATCTLSQSFEFDGHFSQEAVSPDGKLMAVSSTLSTTIYKITSAKADLEKLLQITFSNTVGEQTFTSYPLTSSLSNDGTFIVNLMGITLEAWKFDPSDGSKPATQLWSVSTENTHFRSFVTFAEEGRVLASHQHGVRLFDLKTGNKLADKQIENMKKIVQTQDGNLAALVGDKLFTLSKDQFSEQKLLSTGALEGGLQMNEVTAGGRTFSSTRDVFNLKGIKTANGEDGNFVALVRVDGTKFIDVIDINTLSVVNTFDSPHHFYEVNDIQVVPGTDMILTCGAGDGTIKVIKTFENNWGYPVQLQNFQYNHDAIRLVYLPGTTAFAATFYQKYGDSPKNLIIKHFCAFKHCEQCPSLKTCSQCTRGLSWNEEQQKCAVSAF